MDGFFFVFKKTVSLFLFPMPVLLTLSLAGVALLWFTARQRAGKVAVTAGVIGITLLSFKPLPDYLLRSLERTYPPYRLASGAPSPTSAVAFVVVLAGGHVDDPDVPVTSQLSASSLTRLVEGIRIYRRNPGSKLVVDGWGEIVPTADLMAQVAIDLGVPDADIVAEPRTRDTKDEARLLKNIVDDAPFVLVTAAAHMPRAMAMFRKQGMHPIPAPTAYQVLREPGIKFGDFFPSARSIENSETVVYEYLGWAWARLRGQL